MIRIEQESKPKKVIFKGEVYWLDDNLLCPIDHFTADGEFCAPFGSISYAIIEGEDIKRFGQKIGKVKELKAELSKIEI